MNNFINSLSGPDAPLLSESVDAWPISTLSSYIGSLSGTDESIERYTPDTGSGGLGLSSTESGDELGVATETESTGVKDRVGLGTGAESYGYGVAVRSPFDTTSKYYFIGTISQEVLNNYLDRSMEVSHLSEQWWPGGPGPSYPCCYFAKSDGSDASILYDTSCDTCDHGKVVQMIIDTGAKFVWDIVAFDDGPDRDDYLNWVCQTLKNDIDHIHEHDIEVICGASIAESANPSKVAVIAVAPDNDPIVEAIYTPEEYPLGRSHYLSPGANPAFFDYESMNSLDITAAETRLWYYYMAVRYIDSGAEVITFGNFTVVCEWDAEFYGMKFFWSLCQKIRIYAAAHARRGVVLLNHSGSDASKYYDPDPHTPLPDWERQLIADFATFTLYPDHTPNLRATCSDDREHSFGESQLPVALNLNRVGAGWSINTPGGIHPQGWYCAHMPSFIFFDNSSNWGGDLSGCLFKDQGPGWWYCYGYDQASWFARQSLYVRIYTLIYLYYRIRCLDKFGHLSMPGILNVHPLSLPPDDPANYQILWNAVDLSGTIRSIWNGYYTGPNDWVPHNFTNEEVIDQVSNVASSLIFVGLDRMFYIATDGHINGYVYSGGNWFFVNVSFAAEFVHGTPMSAQRTAKSDLVASPDGTMLLYIGTDGYIHGYNYHSFWDYSYVDNFMTDDMVASGIQVANSLIFPMYDRIYFVAYERDGSTYVYGIVLIPGIPGWQLVSPTELSFTLYGTKVHGLGSQEPPAGALTYYFNPHSYRNDYIFYKGADGFLYYFSVNNVNDYLYVPISRTDPDLHNIFMNQQLLIQGNLAVNGNRIYFIGVIVDARSAYYGSLWTYCVIDNDTSWSGVSPSFSGITPLGAQLQSESLGNIAVSPDGSTIAYFALVFAGIEYEAYLCYYHNIDGIDYSFNKVFVGLTSIDFNSLHFINNSDLFFITSGYNDNVYHLVYEEAYCENPTALIYVSL